MITIARYDLSQAARWDEFVRASSNGTFLHLRGYMDYHADRFADCSLVASDAKGRIVALLPANVDGSVLHSHQGLTYGGWITARRHFASSVMLELWDAFIGWMRVNGFCEFIYKPVPHIYHRYPAEDDIYALFRLGASVESCMVSSAIPLDMPLLVNQTSRQLAEKAFAAGVKVARSYNFEEFMALLAERLAERYGATPVHSVEELTLLATRFPDNIRLFTAVDNSGLLLAGTIVYITDTVIHTQYIATTSQGREFGVFPVIVRYLIENESSGRRYLDFGTSCVDGGRYLNSGLNAQKYGFGARPTVYTVYRLAIR